MKKICITGAGGGIGRAYANILISEGYFLILVDKDSESLKKLSSSFAPDVAQNIEYISVDLSENDQINFLVEKLTNEKELLGLINCAGLPSKPFDINSTTNYDELVLKVNLDVPIRLTKAALNSISGNQDGFIINVCSFAGLVNGFSGAVYAASKSGLIRFTLAIASEHVGKGITFQALCPGKVHTDFEVVSDKGSIIPKPLLLSTEKVVISSLRCLKIHKIICIPGVAYKFLYLYSKFHNAKFMVKVYYLMMKIGLFAKFKL